MRIKHEEKNSRCEMRPLFWPQCNFGSARRSLSRSSRMPDMFRTRASAGLGLCQKSTDYETRSLRSMQRGIRTQAMLHRKRLKDQSPGSCTPSEDCEGIPVLTTVLAVRLWFVGCRDTGSFALRSSSLCRMGRSMLPHRVWRGS